MKRQLMLGLLVSHIAVGAISFGLGIYLLPILTAQPAPSQTQLEASSKQALYTATLVKDLEGSDRFHWGEGTVSLSNKQVSFQGELAPGPDYKLYLAPKFVETETAFDAVKSASIQLGDIKSFDGFILNTPEAIPLDQFNTVVIWCETFGEFISAASYR